MVTEDTAPPPPPQVGTPRQEKRLFRSTDDKVIAGISGGIGRYFDIDPVIVRIAFVVLAVIGGSGVALYLIGWLVIPKQNETHSTVSGAFQSGSPRRNRNVIAGFLLVGGVLIFSGPLFWFGGFDWADGLFIPLMLIAAGIALVAWPDETEVPNQAPSQPAPPSQTIVDDTDGVDEAETSNLPAIRPSLMPEQFTGTAPGESGDNPPPPTHGEGVPASSTQPEPPSPPHPRSSVGTLTIAVLFVLTGGAVLLSQLNDSVNIDPAVFLAIAVMIIGAGLLVSAFVGRARGLIVLGMIMLPFLWFFAAVDLTWWAGVGEEEIHVTADDELASEYRHGMGRFVVDLSEVDLDGGRHEVAIGLTIGELIVYVPDDVELNLDAHGSIGELRVETFARDLTDEGIGLDLNTRLVPSGELDGILDMDLDLGIGSAKIVSVPAP